MPETLEISVVGMLYRVTPGTLEKMRDALPLRCELEREPENLHDENAVKVMVTERPWAKPHGFFHVGFLSREVAAEFASRMDVGKFPFTEAWLMEIDEANGTGVLLLKKVRKAAKKKSG